MTGDRAAEMAFLLLALALPLSALISRRIPIGETVRMVAIWTVIIVGTVLVATIAQGGMAKVKAWLRPGTGDRPLRDETIAARASPASMPTSILHNIYYQDDGDARRG